MALVIICFRLRRPILRREKSRLLLGIVALETQFCFNVYINHYSPQSLYLHEVFNQGEQGERGLSGEDGLPGQQVSFSCWL
jgi:hypothetical protein